MLRSSSITITTPKSIPRGTTYFSQPSSANTQLFIDSSNIACSETLDGNVSATTYDATIYTSAKATHTAKRILQQSNLSRSDNLNQRFASPALRKSSTYSTDSSKLVGNKLVHQITATSPGTVVDDLVALTPQAATVGKILPVQPMTSYDSKILEPQTLSQFNRQKTCTFNSCNDAPKLTKNEVYGANMLDEIYFITKSPFGDDKRKPPDWLASPSDVIKAAR